MNKEQALTKLAALEAETKALRQIIEAPEAPAVPKRWRPRRGDSYSQVLITGGVSDFKIDLTDKEYAHGNCFKTAAQAEIAAKAVGQTLKICAAAFAVDPDAGVNIYNERNWSVVKHFRGGKHEWIAGQYDITTSYPVYVHTFAQAEQMAAILNSEGV